jgi:cation:H+ antiporter
MPSPLNAPWRALINRNWLILTLVTTAAVPAGLLRILQLSGGENQHLTSGLGILVFGLGICAAAFLLTWAAEALQLDIPPGLALAVLATIAVLPEYAVDLYFAWQAGADPTGPYVAYATANMTGANRLLVGLAWPLVALLFWSKQRQQGIVFQKGLSLELLFMGAAALYVFTIPFTSNIALWDSAVLISLFCLYIWLSTKTGREEPVLVGPPNTIGALSKPARRSVVAFLFLYAASIILASAKPFAEGLLQFGTNLGIDEFIMVQWAAPLASEMPEIIIAAIFTLRGMSPAAMTTLISAKVNQMTLLVGTLPIAYLLSMEQFQVTGLPLDIRQIDEIWLTAAQALFGVVLLLRFRITGIGGLVLFLLWVTQLGFIAPVARQVYTGIYLTLALLLLAVDRERVRELGHLIPNVIGLARGSNQTDDKG